MIYNNHYLNKLYNDLVTNSPKTISMNIPSDIGQGKIVQNNFSLSVYYLIIMTDKNIHNQLK